MLFLDTFKIGEKLPPNQYSALELAYIGDAIYEIYVRTMIIADTNCPMKKLHKEATNLVKAKAQADYFRAIEGILTEEYSKLYRAKGPVLSVERVEYAEKPVQEVATFY